MSWLGKQTLWSWETKHGTSKYLKPIRKKEIKNFRDRMMFSRFQHVVLSDVELEQLIWWLKYPIDLDMF